MPLLPLRGLPVNDNHDGPLSIRVEVRSTGSAQVFVRRESDKKTWVCRVRSLQEILAPTQRARPLDVAAIVTCLYDGVAYDSTSSSAYSSMPLKLVRREVAFTQPETWTDGGHRLTMRVAVRSSAIAIPTMLNSASDASVEAVPVVDVADDDVVFGLNFTPTDVDLDHSKTLMNAVHSFVNVKLSLVDAAFPNSYLNWSRSPDRDVVRSVNDGIFMIRDGTRYRPKSQTLATLDILHAKEPVAFAFSVDSRAVPAIRRTTYQSQPGGDLHRTIAQYVLKVPAMSFVQVVLLPGSACALEGTCITFREQPLE